VPVSTRADNPLISIVIPVLDEEECIVEFADRARAALREAGARCEIIFVDDGSRDATPELIAALHQADPADRAAWWPNVRVKRIVFTAGLAYARGDAVVTMDGDLQHPAASLPALIETWRAGADVVSTVRRETGASGRLKVLTSRLFYWLMSTIAAVPLLKGGADFRLMDRRVVDYLNGLPERSIFLRGLVPWLGFKQQVVEYDSGRRFAGRSKFSPGRMLRLALNGLFSFSVVPLRMISLLGLFTITLGFLYGIFALYHFLTGQITGPDGWTSLMVVMLLFGGIQLLSLGIVSEYIARVCEEVKHRPRYVVESTSGFE
jgi:glycosyltransferase involved in cell wall biosynthesis